MQALVPGGNRHCPELEPLTVWGLNVWDVAILAGFLVSILTVGFVVSRSVHKEADFYLGGREAWAAAAILSEFRKLNRCDRRGDDFHGGLSRTAPAESGSVFKRCSSRHFSGLPNPGGGGRGW